jgi:hypothetical protein
MMRPTDTLADLERRRADVALRADELGEMLGRWPHKELHAEFDRLRRLISAYDAVIFTLTKPRRSRR